MAYTIRNSDGTVLLTLPDATIDQVATSVTLIGKNYNSYGQYYNDNLVVMLENFASNGIPPRSPLTGQLWYNRNDARLYVYTLQNVFRPVGVPVVSPSEPTAPNIGDLWIDSSKNQLNFSVDGLTFVSVPVASTATSTSSVKNGWFEESIVLSNTTLANFPVLYNNNTRIAIASSTTSIFSVAHSGLSTVYPGINLVPGTKFFGTATHADNANTATVAGAVTTVTGVYLQVSPVGGFQTTNGSLSIASDSGLTIFDGTNLAYQLSLDNADTIGGDYFNVGARVRSVTDDIPLVLDVHKTGLGEITALQADPRSPAPTIYIWPTLAPSASFVDISSDVLVRGSLTATNILTTGLNVINKGINIGYGQSAPSDTFVNGGGITLIGSTNHTLTWSNTNSAWESNTNFNLSAGGSYKISNQPVINATSLGSVITSAPGVTRLGTLSYLTVTNILITTGTISTVAAVGPANLYLNPAGTGTVDVSYSVISSVSTGSNAYDAANIGYVNKRVAEFVARGYVLSMDITGITSPSVTIPQMLNSYLLPVVDPYDPTKVIPDGSWVRVLCTKITIVASGAATINPPGVDYVTINGNQSTEQFVTSIPNEALFNVTPSYTVTTRDVYEFRVSGGQWIDTGANPIHSF
jgi:hypothetical protein